MIPHSEFYDKLLEILHGGVKSIAPPFLTLVLDGSWWSASRSCCFTPEETAHGTHLIGG
jgi:hypothetical protein